MRRLDAYQDYGEENLSVGPSMSVGQTFKATRDNLAGVRFSVSNVQLGGAEEYEFTILDDKQTVLRSFSAKESNLGWQYTFRYDFAPIADSAGKTYTLNLAFKGSSTSGQNRENLKVAYSKKNLYPDGEAIVNNKPVSGDLTFSTYYQVSPAAFLRDSVSDFTNRLTLDKNFLFSYLALLTVLSIYLLKRIFGKRKV